MTSAVNRFFFCTNAQPSQTVLGISTRNALIFFFSANIIIEALTLGASWPSGFYGFTGFVMALCIIHFFVQILMSLLFIFLGITYKSKTAVIPTVIYYCSVGFGLLAGFLFFIACVSSGALEYVSGAAKSIIILVVLLILQLLSNYLLAYVAFSFAHIEYKIETTTESRSTEFVTKTNKVNESA
jgi:hypothetical protein